MVSLCLPKKGWPSWVDLDGWLKLRHKQSHHVLQGSCSVSWCLVDCWGNGDERRPLGLMARAGLYFFFFLRNNVSDKNKNGWAVFGGGLTAGAGLIYFNLSGRTMSKGISVGQERMVILSIDGDLEKVKYLAVDYTLHTLEVSSLPVFCENSSPISYLFITGLLRVIESPGIIFPDFQGLESPWKSLNLCLKVLESAWIWFSKTRTRGKIIVFFFLPEAFCGLKHAENAIAAGAPPRIPLGELTTLPQIP